MQRYNASNPLSLEPGRLRSQRSAKQKLKDSLWSQLLNDHGEVPRALIAACDHDYLLICKMPVSLCEGPLPPTIKANGVDYPVIGCVVDNELELCVGEERLGRYLRKPGRGVDYRWHDFEDKLRREKEAERKREQRRRKKSRAKEKAGRSDSVVALS